MKSLLIAVILLLLSSSFCSAIAPTNDETIREAQIYGKINNTSTLTDFISPWTAYEENAQKLDDSSEYANLYTPFLLVAADAREKSIVGQTVKLIDSQRILRQYSGYLTFSVVLFGTTPYFSEPIKCVLITDQKTIDFHQASPAEITKTPWYPNQPLYLSKHYFYFPDDQVDVYKPAILVLTTVDKREHKFYFNLNNIR
ncbi:hypothetical protein SDC9_87748 [bioreactor metagenome]|uniref:Uncharacterized protein n=1 Tax=bioreactor metagenome TaxID=1076179 RepID=A0A644ZL76_9ZZZZ